MLQYVHLSLVLGNVEVDTVLQGCLPFAEGGNHFW